MTQLTFGKRHERDSPTCQTSVSPRKGVLPLPCAPGSGSEHPVPDNDLGGGGELPEVTVDQRGRSQEVPVQRPRCAGQVGCETGAGGGLQAQAAEEHVPMC